MRSDKKLVRYRGLRGELPRHHFLTLGQKNIFNQNFQNSFFFFLSIQLKNIFFSAAPNSSSCECRSRAKVNWTGGKLKIGCSNKSSTSNQVSMLQNFSCFVADNKLVRFTLTALPRNDILGFKVRVRL
jgi:hypothetical protein